MRRIGIVVALVVLAGCGGGSSGGRPPAAPPKVTIFGHAVVTDETLYLHHCKAFYRSSSDDVTAGTTVTVFNASNSIVGTASLGSAVQTGTGILNPTCTYAWSASVPPGSVYQVSIGSHNKVTVPRADVLHADITLRFS